MDDRYDPNLILGYVEDELIAADRARVEAMLAEDDALAALVADLRRDRAALRSAPALEPRADLAEGAIAALERQMLFDDTATPPRRGGGTPSRFRLGPLLTYGGIAAVLALTATVVFQSLQGEDGLPMGSIAMDEYAYHESDLARAPIEAQQRAAAMDAVPDDHERGRRQDSARKTASAKEDNAEAKQQRLAAADAVGVADEAEAGHPPGGAGSGAAEPEPPAASVAVLPPPTASEPMAEGDTEVLRDLAAAAPATVPPATPVPITTTEATGPEQITLAESAELALAADGLSRVGGGGGEGDRAFEAMPQRSDADTPADAPAGLAPGHRMSPFADAADPPPRYTLHVSTTSADGVRRQIDAWADTHNVAVVDNTADDSSTRLGNRRRANEALPESANEADALPTEEARDDGDAAPARQQVVLLVDERRINELVRAMASNPSAQVRLVDVSGDPSAPLPGAWSKDNREAGARLEPMFTDWGNWRAVPSLVEVEIVIEASLDALPAGPLRRDAAE